MTDAERKVLEAYKVEDERDPESAFYPYHHNIVAAAGGDPNAAYIFCKSLKKQGLLATNGRQGAKLATAPAYWIIDKGKEELS